MDDLDKYIETRKDLNPQFANYFDKGYERFRNSILLKQNQARTMSEKVSAFSRMLELFKKTTKDCHFERAALCS